MNDITDSKNEETLEAKKARIDGLWSVWQELEKITGLVSLFDRKKEFSSDKDAKTLLQEHGYPPRTRISSLNFETWTVTLNPKFIKDGYIYLLRDDYPDLRNKGFYTRPYAYGQKTTEQLTHDLKSTHEVGYFLYNNELYLEAIKPSTDSIAQELAFREIQIGGSSFISTTTNLDAAIAGTSNQSDPQNQSMYEIYVIKVPIDSVINSNNENYFGMRKDEYLVADYILPEEIIANFRKDQQEDLYQYIQTQLGITRKDLQ